MSNRRQWMRAAVWVSAFFAVGVLSADVATAADPTPNAPVTVTVIDPVYNPINGSVLNGSDVAACRDISFSVNAVVMVKYVRPDGSLIGYSNNFDFSAQAINPYPDANDQPGKAWQERWSKDKSLTITHEGQAKGPGPVDFLVRRSGTVQPLGQGNACTSPTEPQVGQIGAYAFRNGTDKAPYPNNGSFGLASLGYAKYSAGFTFTMKGDPKDIPEGKRGKWRQAEYTQKPFGENTSNDLSRRYIGIEFKYELEDAPTQNYNLMPKATANPAVAEQSDTVEFAYDVTNTAVASPVTRWATTGFRIKPGVSVAPVTNYEGGFKDSSGDSTDAIAAGIVDQLGGKDKAEHLEGTRTGENEFPGARIMPDVTIIPDDAAIGEKYCRALILTQPTSQPEPKYRIASLACATVGSKPSLQVNGGDVSVGRVFVGDGSERARNKSGIVTGTSVKEGKTYGSWGEYAATAPGKIAGFGTQSGLAKGNAVPDPFSSSGLTFSNVSLDNQFGEYAPSEGLGTIPDVASVVRSLSPTARPLEAALGKEPERGSYVYKPAGDVVLDESSIPPGHSIFLYAPEHTVTIAKNITYTSDKLTDVTDIPQVVIVANRIRIDPAVSQVDAWLVAAGTQGVIDTCAVSDDNKTPLSTALCNQQLTINGPVMAHQLWLRRTARGDGGAGEGKTPAEIINLRPDAYLWANSQPGAEKRLLTTFTKELSPRF